MIPRISNSMFKRLSIILSTLFLAVHSSGQHRLSAGIRTGYPFSPQEEMLMGVNTLGKPLRVASSADMQYAFYFSGSSYQGIGASVFSLYDHHDVGTPFSLYVFQGARIARLSTALSLDYEWNFGASFGWHRNQEYPFNTIMGSRVNAYVSGSIMLSWQASDHWTISIGPDFTHYSNGHTSLPNAGLNILGVRVDAAATFGDLSVPAPPESFQASGRWVENLSCDITIFGAGVKEVVNHNGVYYNVEGMFGTAGLYITPFYDFHKHFRAGLSLDLNYDESANLCHNVALVTTDQRLKFFRPSLSEQLSLGLSARVELVMPIFTVHFGVGHNVVYEGHELEGFYQVIALKTRLTRRLYLHTGYQFRNFQNPDHLLLGIGCRIG